MWGAYRKIRSSRSQSGIGRQASWCQTVILATDFFHLPQATMIDSYNRNRIARKRLFVFFVESISVRILGPLAWPHAQLFCPIFPLGLPLMWSNSIGSYLPLMWSNSIGSYLPLMWPNSIGSYLPLMWSNSIGSYLPLMWSNSIGSYLPLMWSNSIGSYLPLMWSNSIGSCETARQSRKHLCCSHILKRLISHATVYTCLV